MYRFPVGCLCLSGCCVQKLSSDMTGAVALGHSAVAPLFNFFPAVRFTYPVSVSKSGRWRKATTWINEVFTQPQSCPPSSLSLSLLPRKPGDVTSM
uniref:Putative glycerol-3-phosphate dehydrogenase n=1 Tax=Ixodes ricinus TaxID=34613 RepID=A0A0K8R569_IXORI